MIKKTLVYTLFFLCSTLAFANELPLGTAITLAGRERMLAQKLGKCYLMVYAKVNSNIAKKEIDQSILSFEQNLEQITSFSLTKEIEAELRRVSNLWVIFKRLVKSDINQENALQLISGTADMVNACDKVAKLIQEYALSTSALSKDRKTLAPVLFEVENQRMLFQKLSMFYVAWNAKIANNETMEPLKATMAEISQGMTFLTTHEQNNVVVDDALANVLTIWVNIRNNEAQLYERKVDPSELSSNCERILQKIDNIAEAYEKMLND